MIKRILIAIAVIACLTKVAPSLATTGEFLDSTTYPPFAVYNWVDPNADQSDDEAIKVDGKVTARWPFDYKYLEVCRIPVKMRIGMYVRVKDCDDKKVIIVQKDCEDTETVNKSRNQWPCYYGCITIQIMANFPAQIRGQLVDRSSVINGDKWSVSATPSEILGDGNYKDVDLCIKTWETKIEKGQAGDETDVAKLSVQARPKV